MKITKVISLFIVSVLLAILPVPTFSHPGGGSSPETTTNLIDLTDSNEIGSYLDSVFNQQMEQNQIVGISAVMVKDGRVVLNRGYGQANLEKNVPIDPSKTLFRIGSVTKVFTWVAVLQLYEQGKLQLDADVNTYLDFHIPDTYPEPITLKHLMSHTAGFEDRKYEMAVSSPEQLQPLGSYLASHIPTRVRPVGEVSSYSNYGTDLAGYIVERVTGMPYADYIDANILNSLGMDQTTAVQPLPADLNLDMSQGYRLINGSIQPGSFELLSTQPSGSISSTSMDMARFMIACLDGGLFTQKSTQQLVFSKLWSHNPEVTGLTHGFWELQMRGQRILYHPGDTLQFHSLLMLIPEQHLGLFFSYNTETALNLWDKTMLDFLQHYYPDNSIPASMFSTKEQLSRFAGTYHLARSSYTTVEKVSDLLEEWLVVKSTSNGTLLFGSPLQPNKIELIQLQSLVFGESQYGIQLAFREDEHKNVTHLIDLHYPAQTYEKVPWYANPLLHYILLVTCCVLFISAILAGLVGGFRYLFTKHRQLATPVSSAARAFSIVTSAIFMIDLVAFAVMYLDKNGFTMSIAYGQMGRINLILAAWLVAALLTFGMIIFTFIAWRKHYWSVISRIHYTLVTLAGVAFIWFLNYWNLLGFRY